MKKSLQITNGIAFVSTVFINYLSNTGLINNATIGDVSDNLNSLFTPAGYAFSIWGLIYLLLLGFVIFQGRSLFVKVKNDDFVLKTGWWFVVSCIANSAWVFAWLYGYTGLSCVFIFLILISLLKIVINNRLQLDDVPLKKLMFLYWPFTIYSGWVTVASIANISSYLIKNNWDGFGISAVTWTIVMIVIATLINLIVTWTRNMRAFAFVGAWALIAIGVANSNYQDLIVYTAYSSALILIISSIIHGYRKRATSPLKKISARFEDN